MWYTAAASPDLLLQPTSSTPDDAGRDPSSGKDYWHKVREGGSGGEGTGEEVFLAPLFI